MTTYLVDLSISYNGTQSNNGISAVWGGATGVLRAASEVAAGDAIHLRNAPTPANNQNLALLMKIPVASTANIAVDDLLVDTTAVPNAALRVAVVVTNDYVIGEYVVAGYGGDFASGHTVTTDGGSTTTTIDAAPSYPGIALHDDYTASGTAGSPITVSGFASDGTTPEATYLDGNSATPGVVIDSVEFWRLNDLYITRATLYGLEVADVIVTGWRLTNVTVNLAASHGFKNLTDLKYGMLIRCAATHCTQDGASTFPAYGVVDRSYFLDNGSEGAAYVSYALVTDTLFANNGSSGLHVSANGGLTVLNCILHSNTGDGVAINAGSPRVSVLRSRITANGGYGIDAADVHVGQLADYCGFYGNNLAETHNISTGSGNVTLSATGYADAGGGDYTLDVDAEFRRVEAAIDAVNSTFITAGFTAAEAVALHDHQVSFHDHEVTFT